MLAVEINTSGYLKFHGFGGRDGVAWVSGGYSTNRKGIQTLFRNDSRVEQPVVPLFHVFTFVQTYIFSAFHTRQEGASGVTQLDREKQRTIGSEPGRPRLRNSKDQFR